MLSLLHTPDRSFPCPIKGCWKSSTREDACKRHMLSVEHPVISKDSAVKGSSAAEKINNRGRKGRNKVYLLK